MPESQSRADEGCEAAWAARLVSVQGQVERRAAGAVDWSQSGPGALLCPGDALRIGESSRAAIELPNDTFVRLDQRSTVLFPEAEAQEQGLLLDLIDGIGYFFSRTPKRLEIRTPFVNAAVEGTELLVGTAPGDASRVAVLEGRVRVASRAGEVLLASGEEATAGPELPPQKRLIARPRDTVAWALYYPPVVDHGRGEAPRKLAAALARFNRGDISGALAELDGMPRNRVGAERQTLRAAILLYVGQVDEARAALEAALALDPDNGDALALQAIVALVLDEQAEAERLARRAADASPASAAPQIALSYLAQSRFDLDEARERARAATVLAPGNALAWARLAELDLALGDFGAARKAAETAMTLQPDLSRTQTVLGFARLLSFDTAEAARRFARAIELDQADPLPRLGLGITKIRRGNLAEGRRELEIAASIDPATSLLRSYLGKAYFDEKRDRLAETEYGIAKGLDPKDPTPWLYDAILKQIDNRPVEALQQMQRSVALNDNRAVYRSRLALDSDLAARGASLARIYADLGFEDQALSEGWRAVNEGPTSPSAHRFLADTYTGRPGYQVARVAELLQSQLWQPLSVNPIQPQLAQPGVGFAESGGPTLAGLNEYHPLFVRDGVRAQANLTVGGDETLADDLAVILVQGGLVLGAGQYHFETDGFRPNADRNENLYNLFVQLAPSPRASLQAEYRHYEMDQGDTALRFDPDDYLRDYRLERTSDMVRLGARYDLSPHSKFIVSAIAEESDSAKWQLTDRVFYSLSADHSAEHRAVTTELQHVYMHDGLNLISGLGYLRVKSEIESETRFTLPIVKPALFFESKEREAWNTYIYANYAVSPTLTLHAGTSYEECRNPLRDRSGLDPKLGLSWRITPATELRAAALSTMRCILSDPASPGLSSPQPESQTIEPTQVAGFNQLFDDASGDGTTSELIGIALDHHFSRRLSGGATITRRDIRVPYLAAPLPPPPSVQEAKWREDSARGYLNFTPSEHWAVSLAYQYEMQDYTEMTAFTGATGITTHRIPLSASFFARSGLSAAVTTTYVEQAIDLYDTSTARGGSDQDAFWVVDAALTYRLPKRWGLIRLEAKNLLDEAFRYQEPDPKITTLYPSRLLLATLSLSFD
jgi:tetratricopeptide (TPR) repeat protein